ncbi:MAG: hypothetical protein FWH14_01915 [Oscillospiraceae bacterium]|nr:hypothetical protein [Oscillospiraceae bacterium]
MSSDTLKRFGDIFDIINTDWFAEITNIWNGKADKESIENSTKKVLDLKEILEPINKYVLEPISRYIVEPIENIAKDIPKEIGKRVLYELTAIRLSWGDSIESVLTNIVKSSFKCAKILVDFVLPSWAEWTLEGLTFTFRWREKDWSAEGFWESTMKLGVRQAVKAILKTTGVDKLVSKGIVKVIKYTGNFIAKIAIQFSKVICFAIKALIKAILGLAFKALFKVKMAALNLFASPLLSNPFSFAVAVIVIADLAYRGAKAMREFIFASSPPRFAHGGFVDHNKPFTMYDCALYETMRTIEPTFQRRRAAAINNDQIVEGVVRGVRRAFLEAMRDNGSKSPSIARVFLDGKQIAMAQAE